MFSFVSACICISIAIEDFRFKTISVFKLLLLFLSLTAIRWNDILQVEYYDQVFINLLVVLLIILAIMIIGVRRKNGEARKQFGEGDVVLLFVGAVFFSTREYLELLIGAAVLGIIHGVIFQILREYEKPQIPFGAYYIITFLVLLLIE